MSDEQHLAWLKQKFSEYDSERQKAEAVLARVRPLLEHTSALIHAIEAEHSHQGSTDQAGPDPESSLNEGTKAPLIMGQRRPSRTPPRRPEYRDMTTVDAALRGLDRELRPWHVNELTLMVYELNSKQDQGFDPAKRTLSSDLVRAARDKRRLQQLGGNYFASNNFVPQHRNGLPTASAPLLPSDEATESEEVLPANGDGRREREERLDGGGTF
jgi:hypothetical protein